MFMTGNCILALVIFTSCCCGMLGAGPCGRTYSDLEGISMVEEAILLAEE